MKWFLLLNLIIVILLFILIRRSKGNDAPSKLNFNKKTPIDTGSFDFIFKSKQENNDSYEKVLNILFQYNGETWDAYEVLGLPAGSHIEAAKKAYEVAVLNQPESKAFLKAALDAVIQTKSSK